MSESNYEKTFTVWYWNHSWISDRGSLLFEDVAENDRLGVTSDCFLDQEWSRMRQWQRAEAMGDQFAKVGRLTGAPREEFRELLQAAEASWKSLIEATPGKISRLYQQWEFELAELEGENAAFDDEGRFFSSREAKADPAEWDRPFLTIDEAVALSFGKSPRLVNRLSLLPLMETSAFARRYAERLEIVTRAIELGDLKAPIRENSFRRWAATKNIRSSHRDTSIWAAGSQMGTHDRS